MSSKETFPVPVNMRIRRAADAVYSAGSEHTQIPQLTTEWPDLSLGDAYAIQRALQRVVQAVPCKIVGYKMGLTSRAKMEQMSVHEPIFGFLTAGMLASDGDDLFRGDFGQPRVEPEIALLIDEEIDGPTTAAQAMRHVGGVCAALEILDSRYQDYKFTLPDVVADNASSARFVLGNTIVAPDRIDIGNLGMVLAIDGRDIAWASSAAVLDHPARSLAALVNLLAHEGRALPAGSVVLTGGITAAFAIDAGQRVDARFDGLGHVGFAMKAGRSDWKGPYR